MTSRHRQRAERDPASARGRAAALAAPRGWWAHPALGAAVVALLLYLPALQFGFVRDDRDLIADNQFLRQPNYLKQLLTTDFWSSAGGESGLWRPLITLSYWLDGRIGGWLPAWFHGVNVVSHALVTALVALLMIEVGAGVAAAWFAALWFAVMPAHAESVAWIAGRTDVWPALFGLAALWMHERGARGRALSWRIGALAAFLLALLSKEMSAPLTAVLATLVVRRRMGQPGGWRAAALELAPYAVLTLAWMVVHLRVAPGALAATPQWKNPGVTERQWTSWAALASYLGFLVPGMPVGPDFFVGPARGPGDPRVAIAVAFHLAALGGIAWSWRRKDALAAAIVMVWLPLALIGFLIVNRAALLNGTRHMYLPSVGVAWLAGVGLAALWKRGLRPTTLPRALVPAVAAAVIVAGLAQSVQSIAAWRTDEAMYREMMRVQPANATGPLGLALVKIGHRRDDLALQALARAEEIDPTRYEIATYRAAIASRRRDWVKAIYWAREARRRGAREADAWLMEGAALQSLQRIEEAAAVVDSMRSFFKSDPDVAAAFGRQMLLENRPQRAVRPLEYAVGWSPDDASLRLLYGDALARAGALDRGREQIREALKLDPGSIDAWLRFAAMSHKLADFLARDAALQRALGLPGADTARVMAVWNRMTGAAEIR